jgi:predicted small lipoprotein YifL
MKSESRVAPAVVVAIVALVAAACGRGGPLPLPSINETKNIVHFIDRVGDTAAGIEVQGWAFIDKADANGAEVFVVLKGPDQQGMFPTKKALRGDVAKQFNNPGMDWSGFSALIKKGAMGKGQYRLGLYVKRNEQQALQFTDKLVTVD